MKPQTDTKRHSQLDDARSPTAEETFIPKVGPVLFEPARTGAWDAEADEDLRQPTRVRGTGTGTPPPAAGVVKRSKGAQRRIRLTQRALALRAEGLSVNAIAQALGVASATVTGWFTRHKRDVEAQAIDDLLDQVAVPLAAENLVHGLLAGDKDYTLETLKGRGRFRRHTEGEGKPNSVLPELRIVFEAPTAEQLAGRSALPAGTILGAPREKVVGTASTLDSPVADVLQPSHAEALAVGRPAGRPDPE